MYIIPVNSKMDKMICKWVFNDICSCLSVGIERYLKDKLVEKVETTWDYDNDEFTVKVGNDFELNISDLSQEAIEGITSMDIAHDCLIKYKHYIYRKYFKKQVRKINI